MKDRYLFKAKQKNWRKLPKEQWWITGYYVLGFNEYEEPIHRMKKILTQEEPEKAVQKRTGRREEA